MGDTGSLALGGLLSGLAIVTRTELLLVVLGGLFVAVTLSVVIQVGVLPGRPGGGCSAWRRCTTTSSSPAGRRTPSSCGSGWSPAMAVAFGIGLFYADWLTSPGCERVTAAPARHRARRRARGRPGPRAARVLLRPRGAGAAHRRRRARRRSPSWSRPARTLARRRWHACPTAPTWWSPRRAGGRTTRCWPTPPRRGRRGDRGARAGLAAARRGPGRRSRRPGWRSPAPTARRRRSRCSSRSCWPAGRRAVAAGNVGRPLVEVVTAGRRRRHAQPTTSLAVELSSFQLHWSSSLAPGRRRRAQRRRRPHRLARLLRRLPRRQGAASCALAPVAVADAGDPVAAALVAGAPAPGDGHPRRAGARSARRPVRARWSTARSAPTRPGEVLLDLADLQVPGPHNRSTPWPPRRWPARPASRPTAVGRGLAGFRGGAHRNVLVGTRGRGRLRRRQQGDQPARRRRVAGRLPAGSCGSPAACSRAPTSIRWSPRSPGGSPEWSCWAATGTVIAASLARHAPMVPVVDGPQRRR